MKIYSILFVFITATFFTSCSKNETTQNVLGASDLIALPDDLELDVNNDGLVDYTIEYNYTDIEPFPNTNIGNFGIFGMINPNDQNQVLTKKQEGNLFLRDVNDISEFVNEPLVWSKVGFSKVILELYTDQNGKWYSNWGVNSDKTYDSYFLGLKFYNSIGAMELGWVEFEVNVRTGEVGILDRGII